MPLPAVAALVRLHLAALGLPDLAEMVRHLLVHEFLFALAGVVPGNFVCHGVLVLGITGPYRMQ